MRHNKKFNHLSRQHGHRQLMLSNMAVSLIMHKRIKTTVPKAKALRIFVEPIITRSKQDTMHARRMAFADLRDKYAVKELFGTVAPKIDDRPGGYTRIVRIGRRPGDDAEICMIELVDFNENYSQAKSGSKKTTTRRSRRGGKKAQTAQKNVAADKQVDTQKEPEPGDDKPAEE